MAEGCDFDALTPCQQAVAVLITEGLTNAEIGARLGLSPHSIKSIVGILLERVGCASRLDLAHWVLGNPPSSTDRMSKLTPAQQKVVQLLVQGCTIRQIAAQCRVHEQTVKNHLTAAYRRFGVTNRVMLARRLWQPEGRTQ